MSRRNTFDIPRHALPTGSVRDNICIPLLTDLIIGYSYSTAYSTGWQHNRLPPSCSFLFGIRYERRVSPLGRLANLPALCPNIFMDRIQILHLFRCNMLLLARTLYNVQSPLDRVHEAIDLPELMTGSTAARLAAV